MIIGLTIPSYERFEVGDARVVAAQVCAPSIRGVLEKERLYEYAARQPDAVPLVGRAPVFAVNLPGGCGRVVVRHNMRGGWMAKVSKDLFVLPTRGYRELLASLRLRASGVSTPEVVAYVSYPKNLMLRRSDVATREIPNGHDLSVALAKVTDHDHRIMVLDAIVKLLQARTQARTTRISTSRTSCSPPARDPVSTPTCSTSIAFDSAHRGRRSWQKQT